MSTPYDIYPQVLRVIDLISNGETVTAACKKVGLPIPTFKKYVANQQELQDALITAEQSGQDILADTLIDIDTRHSDARMAKVVSENIKWLLSKRRVKDYGDKVTVEHTITADAAIIAALDRGRERAQGRLLPPPDPADVIDASFVEVVEDASEAAILAEIMA
ncbi:hypothetical protein [Tepidimonas sp.]|uniref:terminase small subunit-like protein n=1 Tax=Tepidimonas sp. TaxID=2002775 RepID=UPI00391B8E11